MALTFVTLLHFLRCKIVSGKFLGSCDEIPSEGCTRVTPRDTILFSRRRHEFSCYQGLGSSSALRGQQKAFAKETSLQTARVTLTRGHADNIPFFTRNIK